MAFSYNLLISLLLLTTQGVRAALTNTGRFVEKLTKCSYEGYTRPTPPGIKPYPTNNATCSPSCVRNNGYLNYQYWGEIPVSTTITVETVVTIINRQKDTTRTTTISNSEVDLSNVTMPTDVNSAGTRTYLVTDFKPDGKGFTTFAL